MRPTSGGEESKLIEIETACLAIAKAGREVLEWQWDERFQVVLCQIRSEQADVVSAILQKSFVARCDHADLPNATVRVRKIANAMGGLQGDQLLFTTDPDREPTLFAAWWPWGDNVTTSVRIGYFAESFSEAEAKELTAKFKGWFGV